MTSRTAAGGGSGGEAKEGESNQQGNVTRR